MVIFKRNGSRVFLAMAFFLLVLSGFSSAETIIYNNFSDLSALQLNGSTAAIGNPVNFEGQNVLRLTNYLGQGGSAFLKNPITIDSNASFSTYFSFQITNPMGIYDEDGQGADGIVFVVQTNANNVGGAGGGIGYSGIPHSVGVELDTWNNGGWDVYNGNHIGINLNGSLNSLQQQNLSPRMNDGSVNHVWVDYNGLTNLLEVRYSENAVRPLSSILSYNVDLLSVLGTNNVFAGFTSGTGSAGGNHDIRSWQFNTDYNPITENPQVPEPSTLALFGSLFAGIGFMKRKFNI